MTEPRPRALKVLLIEHDPLDAELCVRALERAGYVLEPCRAATPADLVRCLDEQAIDIVVTDFQLAGWTGVDALHRIQERGLDVPVILVTGTLGEDRAVDLLQEGMADYVLKDRLARLPIAVERALHARALRVEARCTEEFLRLLVSAVEQSSEGVVIAAASAPPTSAPIVFANASFCAMTGHDTETIRSRTTRVLWGPQTGAAALGRLDAAMAAGEPYGGELVLYRHGGVAFPADLRFTPLRDRGRITHYVGTVVDATERRQLQEQVQLAQKMEAVGRLAGGVAHDFNNLLMSVLGYTELLQQALPAGDPLRTDIDEIEKAAQRGAGLTRQLLAFSRRQVRQPRPLDLNTVIGELERLLRRVIGADVELRTELASGTAPVVADAGQVGQMLMNLVVNARDAIPEGGRITIGTSREILSEGFPGRGAPVRPGPYVRIAVADTGSGMTPETMAHLFEPFFTTKERGEGTGLGLATVYGIVEQSGGVITVQSRLGAGSTFSIYLPEAAGVAPEEPVPAALASARGHETILVVEDETSVRELAKRVLAKRGYTVHAAAGSAEAIELVEGLGRSVDLLVSDVIMPGLSGPRLAERLVRRLPGLRVLFISGYTEDSLAPHGVLEARTHFLQKPFTPSALTAKIREILDQTGS